MSRRSLRTATRSCICALCRSAIARCSSAAARASPTPSPPAVCICPVRRPISRSSWRTSSLRLVAACSSRSERACRRSASSASGAVCRLAVSIAATVWCAVSASVTWVTRPASRARRSASGTRATSSAILFRKLSSFDSRRCGSQVQLRARTVAAVAPH